MINYDEWFDKHKYSFYEGSNALVLKNILKPIIDEINESRRQVNVTMCGLELLAKNLDTAESNILKLHERIKDLEESNEYLRLEIECKTKDIIRLSNRLYNMEHILNNINYGTRGTWTSFTEVFDDVDERLSILEGDMR